MKTVRQTEEQAKRVKRKTKAKAVKKLGKYLILRGLSLDGPAYEQKWRFEPGARSDLEMVKPQMIAQLIAKGAVREVGNG